MITGFGIENFKGIGKRIEIQFRPLTLLFGANSAGKSTVLHALHYAREVFERHNLDADLTLSGGKYIDLGGFEGFVHGHDVTNDVVLQFEIDISWKERALYSHIQVDEGYWSVFTEALDIGQVSPRYRIQHFDLFRDVQTASVEVTIGWSSLEMCPYVKSTRVSYDGHFFAELTAPPNLHGAVISQITAVHPSLTTLNDSILETSLFGNDSLLALALAYCGEYVAPGDGKQITLSGRGDALPNIDRPLGFDQLLEFWVPNLPRGASAEQQHERQEEIDRQLRIGNFVEGFRLALSNAILLPVKIIRSHLQTLCYLGPLRETPPRTFEPPRYTDPTRWASGLGAWDALHDGSDEFVSAVGDWLGDKNKLNSGYRIERRRFKEIDLANPLLIKLLTGRAFDDAESGEYADLDKCRTVTRIEIIPDGTDLTLRPHDVGIGISQVVPVVVTALQGEQNLIAIEQPELHLHPKLQAELGDLFIEVAFGSRKHQVLLETHSEHIILRLLRRIRETAEEELPEGKMPLKPDDLAVYFIDSGPTGLRATRLRVDDTGEFIDRWPSGFFDERAKELF